MLDLINSAKDGGKDGSEMTSESERAAEKAQAKRALTLYRVADGGLERAVQRAGGELTGFSAKMSGADVLLTLRVVMPAGPMIAWVGGETLASALTKAARQAGGDELKFKPDEWAQTGA